METLIFFLFVFLILFERGHNIARTETHQAVSSLFSTGKKISTFEEFGEVVENHRKFQSELMDTRLLDEILQAPLTSPFKMPAMPSQLMDEISDNG